MRGAAILLVAVLGLRVSQGGSQQAQEHKHAPTLGFTQIKDVSPVVDMDAYEEERRMKKALPGNDLIYARRATHEAGLMNDFLEGFKDSEECNGISFYLTSNKKPEFTVGISVEGHDKHPNDQEWTWILLYPADPGPRDKPAHGMGGMGTQSSGRLTARDVCLTVWDDVDPNHFKKPGGKIE